MSLQSDSLKYEGFELVTIAEPFNKDIGGGLFYDDKFRTVTQGGFLNAQFYTGIKPASGDNIALVFTPADGSFGVPERCVELHDFYFACTTANVMSTLNLPLPCSLEIEAFARVVDDEPGVSLGIQSFIFEPIIKSNLLPPPTLPIYSDMDKATSKLPPAATYVVRATILPGYRFLSILPRELQDVLVPLYQGVGGLATTILFDNITYTACDT
jgi:hypothetical protein